MGNALSLCFSSRIPESYLKPAGLYATTNVDLKRLRKLILKKKLAPCYPGQVRSDEGPGCTSPRVALCMRDLVVRIPNSRFRDSAGDGGVRRWHRPASRAPQSRRAGRAPGPPNRRSRPPRRSLLAPCASQGKPRLRCPELRPRRRAPQEVDAEGTDLDGECPICFLSYPALNRTKCCQKEVCTECFLQARRGLGLPSAPPGPLGQRPHRGVRGFQSAVGAASRGMQQCAHDRAPPGPVADPPNAPAVLAQVKLQAIQAEAQRPGNTGHHCPFCKSRIFQVVFAPKTEEERQQIRRGARGSGSAVGSSAARSSLRRCRGRFAARVSKCRSHLCVPARARTVARDVRLVLHTCRGAAHQGSAGEGAAGGAGAKREAMGAETPTAGAGAPQVSRRGQISCQEA